MLAPISVILAAAIALGPTVSERESVQSLAARANDAFAAGDFAAARAALLEALAIEPDNMSLVYGLAQAERFLDNCPRAVELFDRFLRSAPPPTQADAAKAKRAECTDTPPPEPEPAAEAAPPPPRPPLKVDASEQRPPPPRRPVSRAGPILVGVGAGIAVVGGALVGAAFGVAAAAPRAPTQEDYESRARRVVPLAAAGWTSLAVGLTTAIIGGITWGVARSTAAKRRAVVRRSSR